MSRISGTETKPEILVRKFLFSNGFRYFKNVKTLPGKPDILIKKYNTAIFIHGCFWHGHERCKKASLPITNKTFWENKINQTTERDRKNELYLKSQNWNVIVIWQCEINNVEKLNLKMREVINMITNYVRTNTTRES